jgi:hypothetical protein
MSGDKRPEEADAPASTPWTGGLAQAGGEAPPRPETEADERPTEASWTNVPTTADPAAQAREDETPPPAAPIEDAERARDAQAEAALDSIADAETVTERRAEQARAEAPAPAPAEARGGGFAGKAFYGLVLLIAGGAAAIVGGPKLAPMLPAGVAAWLQPAAQGPDMAAVEQAIESRVAALPEAKAAAETALAAAAGATDRLAELSGRLDALAAQLAALEARPAGAGDGSLAARVEALENAAGGADPAAVAALNQTVAALRADMAAVSTAAQAAVDGDDVAGLTARLDALETARAADAADREAALAQAAEAQREALVVAAKAEIDRAMALGEPFEDAVADAAAAGAAVPEGLAAAAASGAPTRERLKADFAPAAYKAIAAALTAEAADEGMLEGVLARFEARVTGLPEEAIEGDSAAAVLSRARAALLGGDLDAALAGVEALPPAAQEAMAAWSEGARVRRDAETALADWRIAVGAN